MMNTGLSHIYLDAKITSDVFISVKFYFYSIGDTKKNINEDKTIQDNLVKVIQKKYIVKWDNSFYFT